MKRLARAAGAVAAFGAGCFAWGLLEARWFTLRHVYVPVLAPGSRDVRILHVSDIHLLPRQGRKLEFIRSLGRLRPDLVVNTGDNISSSDAVEPLLDAFGDLRDVPGVFVFGSNDYHGPVFKNPIRYVTHGPSSSPPEPEELPAEQLRRRFKEVGWQDLTHDTAVLEAAGHTISFRGTDDGHRGLDDYSLVRGREKDADLHIGVTHAPYLRLLDAMTDDGMDLIMAGHTHGGQVCVPFHGALITNCDLDTRRAKGLCQHSHAGRTTWLHVSAGIGTSPYAPYRFACRPEATLVTLVAGG